MRRPELFALFTVPFEDMGLAYMVTVRQRGISPQRSRRTQRRQEHWAKNGNHGFLSCRMHKSLSLRPLR